MGREVHLLVQNSIDCQKSKPVPNYYTTMHLLVSPVFQTFLIDFAGPFPTRPNGERYKLIEVDHLTRWPIGRVLRLTHRMWSSLLLKKKLSSPLVRHRWLSPIMPTDSRRHPCSL